MIDMNGVMWQWGTLGVGMVVTALLLAVGHWFPWPRRLRRIEAYMYGGSALWVGLAAWRLLNGDWQTAVGVLAIDLVGWGTVAGAYQVDGLVRRIRQARATERTDDELSVAK